MTPKIPVLLKKGKLQFQQSGIDYLYSKKDGWYALTITRPQEQRTLRQNAYYWSVVVKMIADEIGDYPESVHEALLQKFAPKEEVLGEMVPKRSKDMKKGEMPEEYWEPIMQWAAEFLDLTIPLPNEVMYDE